MAARGGRFGRGLPTDSDAEISVLNLRTTKPTVRGAEFHATRSCNFVSEGNHALRMLGGLRNRTDVGLRTAKKAIKLLVNLDGQTD